MRTNNPSFGKPYPCALLAASLLALLVPQGARAQQERADIRAGNRAYYEGKYPEAEVGYKRAIGKNINSYEANFNLAGTLYKQGRYDDATATYGKLSQDGTDPTRQASTYYNIGNTYVKQRKLDEAIDAYKNALRLIPDDKEAKFNLAYAKKLKQEDDQKDQDKNQDQNKDQNKDQNQDDNKQDPGKDPNQDQDKNKDPGKDQDKSGGQPPQPQPSGSREQSEQLLKAIQASEDNTKKKVDDQKAAAVGTRSGKQW